MRVFYSTARSACSQAERLRCRRSRRSRLACEHALLAVLYKILTEPQEFLGKLKELLAFLKELLTPPLLLL